MLADDPWGAAKSLYLAQHCRGMLYWSTVLTVKHRKMAYVIIVILGVP